MEMLVPFAKESVGEINQPDITLTMEKTDGEIAEDNLDWEKEADMDAALDFADRESEFTNPLAIEFNKGNGRRTHIFYCDPQRSDQKGGCEVTHEMIRRVLPKKTSFDNLTQDDINLIMSHINSYNRKKLNNQSAHQLFSFINGGDILDKLGIKSIPANEINLTPLLLKK